MILRASLLVTVTVALGASSSAEAQLSRGCRRIPFQCALFVEVVPANWERTTHAATCRVPGWAVFEIEAASARAKASAESSMYVYALSIQTEVGGIRAMHFNTPPVPAVTALGGGGIAGGYLVAPAGDAAATSSTTALYAGPGSEIKAFVDTVFGGSINGRLDWTLSGHLVTSSSACGP